MTRMVTTGLSRFQARRSRIFAEVMGDIQKKRCRTTGAEPFGETLPELPFIGDQVVCLGQNQPVWSGPALMSSATCGNEEEAHVQTAIATVSLGGTLNEKLEAIT